MTEKHEGKEQSYFKKKRQENQIFITEEGDGLEADCRNRGGTIV